MRRPVPRGRSIVLVCLALAPALEVASAGAEDSTAIPPDSAAASPAWISIPSRPSHRGLSDMGDRIRPRDRVRVTVDTSEVVLDSVLVDERGLTGRRIEPGAEPGPFARVEVPWDRVHSIRLGVRSIGRGAARGAKTGAAPGLVLLGAAAREGEDQVSLVPVALGVVLGVPLMIAGGVAGGVVGTLVGGTVPGWEALYTSPDVAITSDPRSLPVGKVAIGWILVGGGAARAQAVENAVRLALRQSGFAVVEAPQTIDIAREVLGREEADRLIGATYPDRLLDALRERTGADAVLTGTARRFGAEASGDMCSFDMTSTRSHQAVLRARARGGPVGFAEPETVERLVPGTLGNLGALRRTPEAR